jgi:hypothetical protein
MSLREKLYWILFVVIILCVGIKILSIGWFTLIVGIYAYPAILLAHGFVHIRIIKKSSEFPLPLIWASHILLLLAFLFQFDGGDRSGAIAWTVIVWRLFGIAIQLPDWMNYVGLVIGILLFIVVGISWWKLLRQTASKATSHNTD